MPAVKAINSKAPIGTALDYIFNPKKTNENLVFGIGCRPETALEEMLNTKQFYDKKDGTSYKHLSFNWHKDTNITPEQALLNTIDLVNNTKCFEGFEIAFATHTDKDHIHTHIIVNSVRLDGYKIQMAPEDLQNLKDRANQQDLENGYPIITKGYKYGNKEKNDNVTTNNKNKWHIIKEHFEGNKKSWLADIAIAVFQVKEVATSKNDFIQKLADKNIIVSWTDNKYITFQEKDNPKHKARNKNLAETFKLELTKEDLLNEFERNSKTITRAKQGINGTSGTTNNGVAASQNPDREAEKLELDIERRKRELEEPSESRKGQDPATTREDRSRDTREAETSGRKLQQSTSKRDRKQDKPTNTQNQDRDR